VVDVNGPIKLRIASTGGAPGEAFLGLPGEAVFDRGARLLFGGDFCPGTGVPDRQRWIEGDGGAEAPFLASITSSADYSVVNLECPLGTGEGVPKAGPRLHADPSWAGILAASGVDAVALANNHAMDQGARGLASTMAALTGSGLRHFGAGEDLAAASRPLVAQVGDRTVAIFAHAEHESGIALHGDPGVSPLTPETALLQIRAAREQCDHVVVLVHGGHETFPLPRPGLRATCRFLVDCGADAVLCSHSHTIGALEWYSGAPISYGLGNLYFPWSSESHPAGWHDGVCVLLELGPAIKVYVVPTCFEEGRQGIRPLADAEASLLAGRLEALSTQTADGVALERAWTTFVDERRRDYLSMLLGLSRPERLLLRAGVWPFWRAGRDRLPEMLNVVRCESHREALLHVLDDELHDR